MQTPGIHWGISPIGWRNDDMPEIGAENTLAHVLSDMALARFEGTEMGGFFPKASILRKELELRGLKIAGQWFNSYLIRDGITPVLAAFREQCRNLQAVGADVVVVSEQTYSIQGTAQNIFTGKPSFTDDEWAKLCAGLNQLGSQARDYGLKLVYHHHMGTGIQTLDEVDRLMAATDPELVQLLYDSGHIYVSDGDDLSLLRKYVHRIGHVHFKDVRQQILEACRLDGRSFLQAFLAGMFTVPGDGALDFSKAYEILTQAHYQGWIIVEAEQDPRVAHPLEYALKARRYIDEVLIADHPAL